MRQILSILGLAFVAAVLIVNVDAFNCYIGTGSKESEWIRSPCPEYAPRCAKVDNDHSVSRVCVTSDSCNGNGVYCCDSELCNGAVTSVPPAPLLIAVVTVVIAVVGI
ncbi:hypothetical protein AAVH_33411 [Aphelenchoides avenae]|nr:hypothetical protein AAVH_33411 [Aphelenchus avenae]